MVSEFKHLFGIAWVTKNGIEFLNRYYSCSAAISERWFEIALENGAWPIVVLYEPDKEETIVVVRQEENTMHSGELINSASVKIQKYIESIQTVDQ